MGDNAAKIQAKKAEIEKKLKGGGGFFGRLLGGAAGDVAQDYIQNTASSSNTSLSQATPSEKSSTVWCDYPGCEEGLKNILEYEEHYASSHMYNCSLCQKVFTSTYAMEIHCDEVHSTIFKAILERDNKNPHFRCLDEECAKSFFTPFERNEHAYGAHCIETPEKFDEKRKMRRRVEHETNRLLDLSISNRSSGKRSNYRFLDE